MSKPFRYVATIVAGQGGVLDPSLVDRIAAAAGLLSAPRAQLAPEAVDLYFDADDLAQMRLRLLAALSGARIDVIAQPVEGRRKALLVADMDSTMIAQECIDELAELVGLRAEISAITLRAMRGEIDFEEALRARVARLAGVTLAQIEEIVSRLTLNDGARALVATMRAHGAYAALVSGGFTQFTRAIAARLGFDEMRANQLEMSNGALTGAVMSPVLGAAAKRDALIELCSTRAIALSDALAIGDGANDLDMLRTAGLGVAFRAKPKVAAAAHARLEHADLTALLYAQGYRREEFVE